MAKGEEQPGSTWADVLEELYSVPLSDFIATRERLAAAAKGEDPARAKEIGALRKPTSTAWVLNQVVRTEPEVVELVQHVGHRMREATAKGDTSALRQLRPERDRAITEVVAAAGRVSKRDGRQLTAAAHDEVRASVIAALASAEATEAVASGALVRSLSYAGFGEVELDDAVAAQARDRQAARAASRADDESDDDATHRDDDGVGGDVSEREEGADDGRLADDEHGDEEGDGPAVDPAALDEAERELAGATLRRESAEEAHAEAERRVSDLEAVLATARRDEQQAETAMRAAAEEQAAAQAALDALRTD